MNRYGTSRDGEAERSTERLTITPHPLRSHAPDPFRSYLPEPPQIQSPDTPHPFGHSRGQSESRRLLPGTAASSSSSKPIFQYSRTAAVGFKDVDINEEENPFPKWDSEPQTLRKTRSERWTNLGVDLLVVWIVIPFFAIAVAIIAVDGKAPKDDQEQIFRQCVFLAATLFPLVFSLVVGRLAVKLAHYNLERGAKLGFLERLMGSQSFFRTLTTQLRLWPLNLFAICLIIIWLLSPFGSQAILRSLSIEFTATNSATNVTYFNTHQPSLAVDQETWSSWFPSFATLFSTSLLASPSVKTGSHDLWGNIKIPFLSSLANTSIPDSEGWYTIPSNTTMMSSALFGIPISSLPQGTTKLMMETSYISLNCSTISSNLTRDIDTIDPKSAFFNPGLISTSGPFISSQNVTAETSWALGYLGPDLSPFLTSSLNATYSLDNLRTNFTAASLFPGLLLYQDFTGLQNVTSIFCVPSQIYVESDITCSSPPQNCSVIKQRASTLPHAVPTLTLLSFHAIFLALSTLLPLSVPTYQSPVSQHRDPRTQNIDFIQNYLSNPLSNSFIKTAAPPANSREESRFLNVGLDDFSTRLSQIVNTFLVGTLGNSTTLLPSPSTLTPPHQHETGNEIGSQNATTQFLALGESLTVPTTTTTPPTATFHMHKPWLAIFLTGTSTMLLATLATLLLNRLTLSPPYLGYVSSLCREASAVGLPAGGVRLTGMERSRRLRDVRVRFGDVGCVKGWEVGIGAALSVGRLSVGRVQGKGAAEVVRGVGGRGLYV